MIGRALALFDLEALTILPWGVDAAFVVDHVAAFGFEAYLGITSIIDRDAELLLQSVEVGLERDGGTLVVRVQLEDIVTDV